MVERRLPRAAGGAGWWWLGLAAGALLMAGCATRQAAHSSPPAPPRPYLRVDRAPDSTLALQVAVREMTGPKKRMPAIYLVGVTHLGESNYYAAIQERLDRFQVVLYEGIGDAPRDPARKLDEQEAANLQVRLARALGLRFQLEAIRYDRPHFKNADISYEELNLIWRGEKRPAPSARWPSAVSAALAGAEGAASGSLSEGMDELLGIMDGSSFMGVLAHTLVQLVAASPRLQATVKVVLIEAMGAIEGDLAEVASVPEEWQALMHFLIRERNQIVLAEVRRLLAEKRPAATIAVFYGAGHMHDLEARLTAELGYRPVRDEWLSAFSLNPRAAGISEFELNWVRNMVRWQMRPRPTQ